MKMRSRLSGLTMMLSACLVGSCYAESESVIPYQTPVTKNISLTDDLTKAAVLQVGQQVADWQLAQFDIRSGKMRVEGRVSGLPQGWMYATFNIGLLRFAQTIDNAGYQQAVENLSAINQWKLGPRPYHADDQAMGDVYLSLANSDAASYKAAHVIENFDYVLAHPSDRSLDFRDKRKEVMETPKRTFKDPYCTLRWCWADAIFMAPPVLAHLAQLTGKQQYLQFMDKEFWATTDYLFDSEYDLYLRDSRYFDRKDDQGRRIFWGRGNGWVLAGLARTLEYLPQEFRSTPRYVELFQKLSKTLTTYQNADGSWPSSLLEKHVAKPESSATGLLVFAMAWGVNNNLLDKQTFLPMIQRGWQSLVASIHDDGKVGYVQQVAFAPGSATADDTQLYGSGAVLLAAAEVYKLTQSLAE